jgi:predicted ATPase/signal transduction histidine kinase/GAF domain-containing protein
MDLSAYHLQPLREDEEFVLYRARQPDNRGSILALVARRSTAKSIARLQHEFDLTPVLDSTWAARPLELKRHPGPATLILEDNAGDPLGIDPRQPVELVRSLHLAINLASAVGEAHAHGLIHKDIKPANMLTDAVGHVRLTGFGIASRLPRERHRLLSPETIAGTFAYLAPEQTGHMNRSVDSRSDLYALGVTLYEIFTGVLPFAAADPMEWIHCHVARKPTPPSARVRGIPAPVEAIVLKLLAKDAEDRYQTATGVVADLKRCLAAAAERSLIETFPLGADDASDVLRVPEKLYGREQQVAALLAAFDRVVTSGDPELVLVTGYSGIGKSSIVNELHKAIVPARGLYGAGKFDRYKRDIPYATLGQAFENLVRELLAKNDEELGRWRGLLLEALGANGALMVNLIPELGLIIGEQQPVPDLPIEDRQNRFQQVFRRFLGVFARAEHPLAIFLDDLQWLDRATLELIGHVATHSEVRHLLIVGAYRDNEVGPSHPLMPMLAAIRAGGARAQEIPIAPLELADIERLLSDALRCEQGHVHPLAVLVFQKTGGNPLFAIQFIASLFDHALLAFDRAAARWIWDLQRIRDRGFTDNIIDLMSAKLGHLPPATRNALGQFACLGNVADIGLLALILGETEEGVHALLWEAVHAGLVHHVERGYEFLHDRVQEAAYALIGNDERVAVHLRIGRLLAAPGDQVESRIFDIVNQYAHGAALVQAAEEREQVAEFNLRAGLRAKAASAYVAARQYFATGLALLGEDAWEHRFRLAFTLELNLGECEYVTGDFASAELRLSSLATVAKTNPDSAAVARVLIYLHTNLDQSDRAVTSGLAYLRRVSGWSWQPAADYAHQEYDRIRLLLDSGSIESALDLPPMKDPDLLATMDVLTALCSPAQFTDLDLFRLIVVRMAVLSLQEGNSDATPFAYTLLGGIVRTYLGNAQAGFRLGKLALDLIEKRGFARLSARAYLVFAGHVAPWTQHLASCRPYLQRSFDAARDAGDLTCAAYARVDLVTNLLATGAALVEVEREAESALDFVRGAHFGLISDVIIAQLRLIRTLRGEIPDFGSFNDAAFDESRFEQHLESDPQLSVAASRYWIRKLQARVYAGDYESAIVIAAKAAALLWTLPSQVELPEYHFYAALAEAGRCDAAAPDERVGRLTALSKHHQQFVAWAEAGRENFGHRAALLGAEVARLEGRELDAMRLYEDAIRAARQAGFVQNEGLSSELAARFHNSRGLVTIADAYLQHARSCYVAWGADGKVRRLDQGQPALTHAPLHPTATISASVEQLDLATIVRMSQVISGEIDLGQLIEVLVVTALEHAGAERGLLILPRARDMRIEAEAKTIGDHVKVSLRRASVAPAELPESILRFVMRTQQSVLLDDAMQPSSFGSDEYIQRNRCRSILCLPLVKQAKLTGVLYLENALAPNVFTPNRVAVLRLLASQAAISLENARLFSDLQHAETYLTEAQRLSHTGSFGWSPLTGDVVWSEQTFRIFECEPSTKPTVDLVLSRTHPDDLAVVERLIKHVVSAKEGFDYEHRLVMPDGRVKHIHVVGHPVPDESSGFQLAGAVMDITARKEAQAALEQSERRYRALFRDMPVALWQLDAAPLLALLEDLRTQGISDLSSHIDGHASLLERAMNAIVVEEVNDDAVAMFGARTPSDLLGPLTWVWRESPDAFRRWLEGAYRNERHFQTMTKLPTRDGRVIDVLFSVARPRATSKSGVTLVSLIDLTESVRTQALLERVQADFAHAARISMLGEFTASIAHELNQPLAAIITNGQAGLRWLDRPEPDLAKAQLAATRMIGDARRSADIIARIRAMAIRKAPEPALVSLDDVIVESLMFLRHDIQRRGISVLRDLAADAPKVLVDRVQLQQVIVNLLVNAMQAMTQAQGSEFTMTIRTSAVDKGTVRCTVEDSGPGIEPSHLTRLFESFFTTKKDGIGIGLAVCRSIVEAYGGCMGADNESAHGGARFHFMLPAAGGMASCNEA